MFKGKIINNTCILICILLITGTCLSQNRQDTIQSTVRDSIASPQIAYRYIRGIDQDEEAGFRPLWTLKKGIVFIPEQFAKGVKFASGYGVDLIDDPKFLNDLESFFFNSDRSIGWYPIVDITSQLRPRAGFNLVYHHTPFQAIIKGKYADEEKFKIESRFSFFKMDQEQVFRANLNVLYEYDDDRKFYGFGADPQNDPRNHFYQELVDDHGIYFQEHKNVQMTLGYKPHQHMSYYYSSSWDQRYIRDADEGTKTRLYEVMDVDQVPGMNSTYNQWYYELSWRFNSHNENRYLSRGFFSQFCLGIDKGMGSHPNLNLKTGLDMFTRIPVIQENRVLTPRLVVQTIKNLDNEHAIPFAEYPDHYTFRGVNTRTMLRVDNVIMVPSLQYSWPLSFNLGGHVFMDYLLSGKNLKKTGMYHAPWAAGFILDFHSLNEELANAKVIYGSEGWRFHIDIGVSLY